MPYDGKRHKIIILNRSLVKKVLLVKLAVKNQRYMEIKLLEIAIFINPRPATRAGVYLR